MIVEGYRWLTNVIFRLGMQFLKAQRSNNMQSVKKRALRALLANTQV